MKCPRCKTDNKDGVKNCRKCGMDLYTAPVWSPTWKWHARALVIIYVVLIAAFFALNYALKPYMRHIPKDVTPWLKEVPSKSSVG